MRPETGMGFAEMRERRQIKLKRCCEKFEPEIDVDMLFTVEIKCPKCGRRLVLRNRDPRTAVGIWNKEIEKCQESIAD